MAQILKFPKGFLWGASTSAHQVEGGNHNSWSEWEMKNAKRLAEDAKTHWQPWQQEKFPEKFDPSTYISGNAADHYNKFEEDFDLAKSLGHNAHRFSIEWSRIEPEEGKFNTDEIEHYRYVLRSLKKRDLVPFVTLWHWPMPLWLEEKGGWKNSRTPVYFERYVQKLVDELGGEITFWITLNEPEVYAGHSFLKGFWPPQQRKYFTYRGVIRNLVRAHKDAYTIIKRQNAQAQVCVAKHNVYFEAYRGRLVNKLLKRVADWWWNEWFLRQIRNYQDILTINNYHHNRINYGFNKNTNEKVSDFGWELYPESLAMVARELKRYKLPIYVTEHGLADAEDTQRAWYVRESLRHLHSAIKEGVDVKGYLHWSLLDNFEWDKGTWLRFGLVEVDFETQERKVRPSAYEYKQICESNMLTIE